jgi:hypothetical protein
LAGNLKTQSDSMRSRQRLCRECFRRSPIGIPHTTGWV